MAQLLRRRPPARMELSPRVAHPGGKIVQKGKPVPRRPPGPFGGMNVTSTDMHRQPRSRSEAELKRSFGGSERPHKKDRDSEPFKALKMQRGLTLVSYGHRNSVKSMISTIDTFDEFSLLPTIKESIAANALSGMKDISPTPIQRLAIPTLLGDDMRSSRRRSPKVRSEEAEQYLLAAETGSGKTLAYLLPVLDSIKRIEASDAETEAQEKAMKEEEKKKDRNTSILETPPLSNTPHPTTARPRAIILVPTAELVAQVGKLAKSLSHTVKFRSALISAAYTGRVIRNRLFATTGVDVVISTPHILASIAESDPHILSRVSHLVVDEADSLLDRSFSSSTNAVIDRASPSLRQLIFCSATIPRSLDSYLQKSFPDMRRLVTPNLHAIPRRVLLGVVDIDRQPYCGNRSLACADTIWSIGKAAAEHVVSSSSNGTDDTDDTEKERVSVKRILVFVNEREKAEEVADYLRSKGIEAVALNRDTSEQRQPTVLDAFTSSAIVTVPRASSDTATPPDQANYTPMGHSPRVATPSRRHLNNTKVLVATDLGSRGIDTLAVRHVILYDVPHTTIDFIHRLGRTGRMGRRGRGIVLVGKGDRKDVVREVREGMYRGQALI
ncbi:RNA helicase [Pseudocyphellaria aurata]|nr:RNA helicase [Pseudocyphellaria aurata]